MRARVEVQRHRRLRAHPTCQLFDIAQILQRQYVHISIHIGKYGISVSVTGQSLISL